MKFLVAVLALQLAVVFAQEEFHEGGGYALLDDDDRLENMKWVAIEKINAESKESHNFVPVKTIGGTEKCTGMVYEFEMEVAEADCAKAKVSHDQLKAKPCKLKVNGKRFLFQVEVAHVFGEHKDKVKILSYKEL